MKFIIKIAIYALAILLCAYILPGIAVDSVVDLLIVTLLLIVFKAVLKPILVLLTLPITIMTLGLFVFVLNALIILLTDYLVAGFHVQSFWWALLFSLILSVLVAVFESFDKDDKHKRHDHVD
jgi:putative membrane protein